MKYNTKPELQHVKLFNIFNYWIPGCAFNGDIEHDTAVVDIRANIMTTVRKHCAHHFMPFEIKDGELITPLYFEEVLDLVRDYIMGK